ncbi:MAG: sigma-70 family RNA polymerase sigma factor [Roseibium album]|uniref:Uncharacterized protein n=1 Tax=Roseibium album TaxID=311410 RepID=A0A0M7AK68_9HYPH|nr:sigma-70 family RNA polymerase sigma factor [Roseibium album]MBG6155675.1 hypothetical protein [Labrenzia sp. EL_162]MBG6161130.1 hypothetical protein [Labrenzia sp. EL_195]MBG6194209.1 hypothetical protein [Labrenzia sp. EL_159]CTQ61665.1 hypothetical protein LA5094_04446 [Roseibium album]CTQ75555.1 hypothetical protein LA5096_04442 [Roseibium album]
MAETLRARAMRAGDGAAVVELWKRYLPNTENWDAWLPDLLEQLVQKDIVLGGVVFTDSTQPRCVAAGITCFLPQSTVDDFVARPKPYLNRRLLVRFRDGDTSVFLSPEEQARQNADAGLEMFVLEYCQETFDFEQQWAHEILNAIVPVYIASHTGFNIKRCLHETELVVGHIQEAGGNPFLFEVAPQDPFSLSDIGHGPRGVYGVSRESLTADKATGIAKSLLYCQSPKFQLVLQEQKLVHHALEGLTDVEIAEAIGVSRDRVRQIWQRIYAHLEDVDPEFFSSVASPVEGMKRGGERRRVSVAYLRSHPEELRPRVLRRN